MNRSDFYDSLRTGLLGPRLSQDEVEGCEAILDATRDWPLPWTAYALATALHETAHTMRPILELGGKNYFRRRYDIEGLNPRLAKRLGNTRPGDGARFAGRGFVQITGRKNYQTMGERLDLPLEEDPDLALETDVAARILKTGMGEGLFTGKSLADFFCGAKCEPVGARRVVNGQDKAREIAGYFHAFQDAL